MASCFWNICAKNRQNPLILSKVAVDNVGISFLRHSVVRSVSQRPNLRHLRELLLLGETELGLLETVGFTAHNVIYIVIYIVQT